VQFFKDLGYEQKSEQESLRETWEKDGVEVMMDTWPFLETYIEIESDSESRVKALAVELGFKWSEARFGASLAPIVKEKYGLSENEVNNNTPKIVFGEKNPFDKKNRE
jgi:adenylate cyclase class IV